MTQWVLCLSDYPTELVSGWTAGADVEVLVAPREDDALLHPEVRSALPLADVVIADASRRLYLDRTMIAALTSCRQIIVPAVGKEGSVDLAAADAAGIPVVGAPGYNADAVADWTIWAMLTGLRSPSDLRSGGWSAPLGRELGAVTVGLVGYGAIGSAVARRLGAFGTRVLHHTSRPDGTPRWRNLTELFSASDVVSLHLPLTDTTRGLVDASLLDLMPEASILINAARGDIVVEADLIRALRTGRPARAVLDVYGTEPLPQDSPLRGLDSVFLSPHTAASTEQARTRVRSIVADHLRRALDGH